MKPVNEYAAEASDRTPPSTPAVGALGGLTLAILGILPWVGTTWWTLKR